MKIRTITKTCLAAFTVVCFAGSIQIPVNAQGFGGGMPPEIAAKIKLWSKWRDSHKNLDVLQTMLYQIRFIDKTPETALSKEQAGKAANVLKAWRHKPDMSEDQARSVSKQLGDIMTIKQIKKMSTIQPPWKKPGGMKPPAGGAKMTFPDPPAGGYNPINPDTLPFVQMRPAAKHDGDAFISDLEKRAKG